MGYFVTGYGTVTIKKADEPKAYKAICALNDNDDLKNGGSWGGGELTSDHPRPAGLNHHPARWFSWTKPNYPDLFATFTEVIEHLGFEITETSQTDETNTYELIYDSKRGQEDLFLEACAPYLTGQIEWTGEDGARWRNLFDGKTIINQSGRIVYS
jgi:hypothetical protein